MSIRGRRSLDDTHVRKQRNSLPTIIHRACKSELNACNSELSTTKHLTVSGDRISYSTPHRNYIYHRQPFDWYDNKKVLILDDMEEILPIRGSLPKPHVRSIFDSAHYFKAFTRYSENFVNRCHDNACDDTDMQETKRKIPSDDETTHEQEKNVSPTTEIEIDTECQTLPHATVSAIMKHTIFKLLNLFCISFFPNSNLDSDCVREEKISNPHTARLQTQ